MPAVAERTFAIEMIATVDVAKAQRIHVGRADPKVEADFFTEYSPEESIHEKCSFILRLKTDNAKSVPIMVNKF